MLRRIGGRLGRRELRELGLRDAGVSAASPPQLLEAQHVRAAHDELQRTLPYIKAAYANGDECTYRNTRVPLLVSSALEYLNAADGGPSAKLKLLYFQDAPALALHVAKLRKDTTAEQAQFFCGAVRISKMQHHAAVVGLIKNDRAALLVLDSLISKNVQNGSGPVKQFKYRAGRLRRFFSNLHRRCRDCNGRTPSARRARM